MWASQPAYGPQDRRLVEAAGASVVEARDPADLRLQVSRPPPGLRPFAGMDDGLPGDEVGEEVGADRAGPHEAGK